MAGACWEAYLQGPRRPGNLPPSGSLPGSPHRCREGRQPEVTRRAHSARSGLQAWAFGAAPRCVDAAAGHRLPGQPGGGSVGAAATCVRRQSWGAGLKGTGHWKSVPSLPCAPAPPPGEVHSGSLALGSVHQAQPALSSSAIPGSGRGRMPAESQAGESGCGLKPRSLPPLRNPALSQRPV